MKIKKLQHAAELFSRFVDTFIYTLYNSIMNNKRLISEKTYDEERALYNLCGATVQNCKFQGPADGESALKECRKINLENCSFSLRYPVWHAENFEMKNCAMDGNARAALWYCKDGTIKNSTFGGIKALRECRKILFNDCMIISPEFGWRCRDISMTNCNAESEYFMFECQNIKLKGVKFKGKYSFQYLKNSKIEDCDFDTKDAFWHAENVTVKNSVLRGEYLGWYSKGLTIINCLIIGTQPLCYCKNLKLVNCRTEGCDLAFEYSDVNADVAGEILSVKNPKSGRIVADGYGDVIFDSLLYACNGKVVTR